jgi:hypothetical protein
MEKKIYEKRNQRDYSIPFEMAVVCKSFGFAIRMNGG